MNIIQKNKIIFYSSMIISLMAVYLFSPITQSQEYHFFAEQRNIFGIPHFGDVLSNLGFIYVGLLLLLKSQIWKSEELYSGQNNLFKYFCLSSIILGFGSGYYHWEPTNATLAWDRATMVLGFSVIFYDSCIRYKIFNSQKNLLFTLLTTVLFLGSVEYWNISGRLEPYVFVQFFTMFILVLLAIKNYTNTPSKHLFNMFIWYAIAKICENQDKFIFILSGDIISGHTLKHLAYAVALYVFGKDMLKKQNYDIIP